MFLLHRLYIKRIGTLVPRDCLHAISSCHSLHFHVRKLSTLSGVLQRELYLWFMQGFHNYNRPLT